MHHLEQLEAEAIHVIREVAAELERPVLLFSGGKDSIVLLHLARKAFRPGEVPFPVMHVDTGHNFPEVIEFRDRHVPDVLVASVQESIDRGRVRDEPSRNQLQTTTLLDAIEEHGSTPRSAARGATRSAPARRSACSRSATTSGSGTRAASGRSCGISTTGGCGRVSTCACSPCRTGPSSMCGSTSAPRRSSCRPIYFAHEREVFERDGMLYAVSPFVALNGDTPFRASVRYRTVGDMTCTGAVRSCGDRSTTVIAEIAATRITERGETRADDRVSEAAMEDRKRVGYF